MTEYFFELVLSNTMLKAKHHQPLCARRPHIENKAQNESTTEANPKALQSMGIWCSLKFLSLQMRHQLRSVYRAEERFSCAAQVLLLHPKLTSSM